MKKQIEERKEEVVICIKYSFHEILSTFLDGYFSFHKHNEQEPLIEIICSQIDFQTFSQKYCDGVCQVEDYFLYIYEHKNIEDLVRSWSFDTERFNNDFIVPFFRDTKLNKLLN